MQVLLVSGDYETRIRRAHALEDAGYTVTVAESVPHAWALSTNTEWDLVIVDFDISRDPVSLPFGVRYIVLRLEHHATDEYVIREVNRLLKTERSQRIN